MNICGPKIILMSQERQRTLGRKGGCLQLDSRAVAGLGDLSGCMPNGHVEKEPRKQIQGLP